MAKNYNDYKYFENRPDVVKIFDDLEAFLDFCRMEMFPYNEADLYNRDSWVWRNFEKSRRPKKQFNGNNNGYRGNNNYRTRKYEGA